MNSLYISAVMTLILLPVSIVFADTAVGNGYALEQTVSSTSYTVIGNGYSAIVTSPNVMGSTVGSGFVSRSTSDSQLMQKTITDAASAGREGSQGGGSSGSVVITATDTLVPVSTADDYTIPQGINTDNAPALIEYTDTIRTASRTVSGLWDSLGGTAYAVGGVSGSEPETPVSENIIVKTFDSKATFGLFSVLVAVMLFFALSVSVFGYNEIPKITSVLVGAASILGFLIVSDIYILPAILAFICLLILLTRQSQREILPTQNDLSDSNRVT